MVKGAKKVGPKPQKVQKAGHELKPQKGRKGASKAFGPDEFVKKMSKTGIEFSRRFASGLRYLSRAYVEQKDKKGDEGFEAAFRDVINDILEKSGLNYESIVDFTLKQYKKFLDEYPEEKMRIKKEVTRMSEKIKEKKSKPN